MMRKLLIFLIILINSISCSSIPCRYQITVDNRSSSEVIIKCQSSPSEKFSVAPQSKYTGVFHRPGFTLILLGMEYSYNVYDFDHWFPVTHRSVLIMDENDKAIFYPDRLSVIDR